MLSKSAVRSSLTLTVLAVLGASTIGTAPFQPNFFVSSAKAAEAPTQGQLPDFVSLVEQNGPAVVNIQTVRKARKIQEHGMPPGLDERGAEIFRHFGIPFDFGGFGGPQTIPEQRGTGSGFIISSDGIIMTNAHVVEDSDELIVRLTDKREFSGKVLGSDKKTDIAIVKIDAKDLPVLRIGDSNQLKVGEWVAAIGSPFGVDNTVTAGIVSALSRDLPSDQYVPFIQTDVAVNPGNSGGPLFNMKGEVVGINSQIFSTSGGFMGLSFAIPIDLAMQIKDQLIKDGKVTRGYIGVYIQEMNQDLAKSFGLDKPEGALVTKVEKGSPAEKAGLKSGDIIVAVNGKPVNSSIVLPRIVSVLAPGKKVQMTIIRDQKKRDVDVTIGVNKDSQAKATGPENEVKLGVTARALSSEEADKFETNGLLVTKVEGLAASAGIHPGDILVSANGKNLKDVDDLKAELKGSKVLLLVQRDGGRIFLSVKFPKEEAKK